MRRLAIDLDVAKKSELWRAGDPGSDTFRALDFRGHKPFRHFPAALGTLAWWDHKIGLRPLGGHGEFLMPLNPFHSLKNWSDLPVCPATSGGWKTGRLLSSTCPCPSALWHPSLRIASSRKVLAS